jgi:uncharacterized protein YbjT (DUF2867 family)
VPSLIARGHEVRVLSRRGGSPDARARAFAGDLVTGDGLPAALDGVDTVVDVANVPTTNRDKAVRYFTGSMQTLGRLGAAAGVTHLVVLSIVGCDRVRLGYHAGKLAQERAALDGPIPATVLRATQFHEFARQNLGRFRLGPVALMPGMRCQPVAAAAVADVLAGIADGPPVRGRAPDIGGPGIEWLPDMARAVAERLAPQVRVVTLRMPGSVGRAMRDGSLTLDADGMAGGPSFTEWLTSVRASP